MQMSLHPLLHKIASIASLSEPERSAVERLPYRLVELGNDQDVVREGDRPSRSCILLDGMACSYKMTGEGKRQIVAFHITGDMPDLQSLHLTTLDSSVGTLSPCSLAFVQHEHLLQLCDDHPGVARALWRMTLIDAAIFREWTTNIGQRSGVVRVAHLLCEFAVRLRAIGLATGDSFELPISQARLAEATGMSTVHMNRILQELRGRQLIHSQNARMELLDWPRFSGFADFSEDYLHLQPGITHAALWQREHI